MTVINSAPKSNQDIVLDISDVAKSFGPVVALKRMNLTVRRGRVHTLLGENGAGKSTLMKILAGLFKPTSGTILFKGEPYTPKNPRDARASGISIVFQELSLSRNLSVAENILANNEPSRFGFIRERELNMEATRLIAELGLPVDARAKVGDLSIAQRQLVEIAKGLSRPADVVILDEPTSSLSDSEAEILFTIIERLKAQGTAVIYISHRMEEIMRLSDDITVVRDGEYVTTTEKSQTSIDKLIALMVGREMNDIYPPREAPRPSAIVPSILETRNLSVPGKFNNVSIDVKPGEVLGLFGLVGSGRSDVMKALFGMLHPTGDILLDGKPINLASPAQAIANGIAFVTENRKEEGLVLPHSVERNINMVALGQLAGPFGLMRSSAERSSAKAEVLRLAIKTASIDTVAGSLSGGNQQKIVLAKWLQMKPKILILDEPTRGVDVGAKFEIYRIIRELAAHGAAILMVSSELPEVLGLSDRVVVMHNKHVAATLDADGLTPETVMSYAAGMHQ
ncbi:MULTISPECIES: sugar ABC transporter ATP-binding protein [Brucella/Ochrobactrum group]|uniref:sugar ABC transporter ATP-binding protein n=1 Tax=Brucella/Ochrobactrum group TaxID=2826938 RepID=UPI0016551DCA|nr:MULTISPECIES: sugar ABC transporter ATP-binding protein [Brucella/Ochrobactrum group]MBC8718472.1 sugar ABC transporter ATP-binding protein [Ochrobactrum sp. Marseille-Q0166]